MSGVSICTSMPSTRSRSPCAAIGKVISVGATLPVPTKVVLVRLVNSVTGLATVTALPAAPVLNSVTVPVICTRWPGETIGVLPVNTKMPSEVAGLPSPAASCR